MFIWNIFYLPLAPNIGESRGEGGGGENEDGGGGEREREGNEVNGREVRKEGVGRLKEG